MSTARWDPVDEKRVALALRLARDGLSDKASGSDIVMATMKTIVDIERRTQVGGPRLAPNRACWVQYDQSDLTATEREDIFNQRMAEIAAGEPVDVVFGFRLEASIKEQEIMESVMRVFRACLVGHNQIRDWKILFAFAKGRTSRAVGRAFKISHSRALDCQALQVGAIWTRVKRLLPAAQACAA